jgi:PAS domain S-box-containing protein
MSRGRTRDDYADLLADIPDSILVLDDTGDVDFVNQRVVDALGIAREDILGRDFTEFSYLLEDERAVEAFIEAVDRVLEESNPGEQRLDFTLTTADAGQLEAEARIVPEQEGAMVVMRDVTDRVESRKRLETLADQLALVNRLLRHDIRNELNVIQGWAGELDTQAEGDQRKITGRIVEAAGRAVRLTKEAHEVTEALETAGELPTYPVQLDTVVERAVETAADEFPSAEIVGPGDCPEVEVLANDLLESVFRNLLTNAVVHNDSETPRVEVTGTIEDGTVAVSVADNGPGIPESEKQRIFDRDHRAADSPGTGLGLFLVDFLTTAYDGSVSVEDNEPRGAVFTVRLPVASDDP